METDTKLERADHRLFFFFFRVLGEISFRRWDLHKEMGGMGAYHTALLGRAFHVEGTARSPAGVLDLFKNRKGSPREFGARGWDSLKLGAHLHMQPQIKQAIPSCFGVPGISLIVIVKPIKGSNSEITVLSFSLSRGLQFWLGACFCSSGNGTQPRTC